VSEMVRSSAGREFHDAGPEKQKVRSPKVGAQPRCGVAVCRREKERRPDSVVLEVGCTMSAR